MGHSSKSKPSSKHSYQGSAYMSSSSSKPSYSTTPTPLERYLGSGEPHERVATGWAGDRQSGQQMVQQFDNAWSQASSSSNTYYSSSGGR